MSCWCAGQCAACRQAWLRKPLSLRSTKNDGMYKKDNMMVTCTLRSPCCTRHAYVCAVGRPRPRHGNAAVLKCCCGICFKPHQPSAIHKRAFYVRLRVMPIVCLASFQHYCAYNCGFGMEMWMKWHTLPYRYTVATMHTLNAAIVLKCLD